MGEMIIIFASHQDLKSQSEHFSSLISPIFNFHNTHHQCPNLVLQADNFDWSAGLYSESLSSA